MIHSVARLRVVAMLLCAVVAFCVSAAPAPVYRHRPAKLWFDGWDEPIDKVGGCKFARDGEKLTITAPGSNSEPVLLLREVEGDFVLVLRVSGDFHPRGEGHFRAGVALVFGGSRSGMDRVTESKAGTVSGGFRAELSGNGKHMNSASGCNGKDMGNVSYLRVSRKGNELILEAKEAGGEWTTMNRGFTTLTLPKKIKVGVSAEATAPGPFRVEFDQFELTKPAK